MSAPVASGLRRSRGPSDTAVTRWCARARDDETGTDARGDAACRDVSPVAHARRRHVSAGRVQRTEPDRRRGPPGQSEPPLPGDVRRSGCGGFLSAVWRSPLGNFGLGAGDDDRTVIIAGGVGEADQLRAKSHPSPRRAWARTSRCSAARRRPTSTLSARASLYPFESEYSLSTARLHGAAECAGGRVAV